MKCTVRVSSLGVFPIIIFVLTSVLAAQEVPVDKQADILLKVLGYNRTILNKTSEDLRIGIIYSNITESLKAFEQMDNNLFQLISEGRKVDGKNITYSGIAFKNEAALKETATILNVDVLYITPGNDENLAAIKRIAKNIGIMTFSGVKSYVTQGLASGVELVDGKPKIIINLPDAKDQGANFKAELLAIASVLQ